MAVTYDPPGQRVMQAEATCHDRPGQVLTARDRQAQQKIDVRAERTDNRAGQPVPIGPIGPLVLAMVGVSIELAKRLQTRSM